MYNAKNTTSKKKDSCSGKKKVTVEGVTIDKSPAKKLRMSETPLHDITNDSLHCSVASAKGRFSGKFFIYAQNNIIWL